MSYKHLAAMRQLTNIDELFTNQYGPKGSISRTEFEEEARAFMIAEMVKEEHRLAKLSQEELALQIRPVTKN